MKLDVNVLRYLSKDDFRTLTAVEMGQKNHEIVPIQLIESISGLKHGGAFKCLKTLLRHKLVHHENQKYDGYRLTYMGYDFLAIRALTARGHIAGVGRQIGVGKESDIFEVMNDEGEVFALKLHRLGRTSFRAVKSKRDYLGRRSHFSWLYLSRLAALKEFAFMKALGEHGFPVPQAIDNNRHAVLMTLVNAHPLVQVKKLRHPAQVYLTCMELISRLAGKGLIHCDFNEFNLLISDEEELTIIDFPQMISVSHANAQEYFERDVECIVRFFTKKVGYNPENDPALPYVRPSFEEAIASIDESLDVDLAASGFQRQHQQVLEAAYAEQEEEEGGEEEGSDDEEDEGEEESSQGGPEEAGADTSKSEAAATTSGRSSKQGTTASAAPDGQHSVLQGSQEEGSASEGSSATGLEIDDDDPSHHEILDREGDGSHSEEDEEGDGDEEQQEAGQEETRQRRRERRRAAAAGGFSLEGGGASGYGTYSVMSQSTQRVHAPLGQREVQALVAAQRKKQLKHEAIVKAARNASKPQKGKGTRKGGGSKSAGADFGGW